MYWVVPSPDLAGGLDPLEPVGDGGVGAPLREVVEALRRRLEESHLHEEDADHGARPPLAPLAVHHNNIVRMLPEPLSHIVCELQHLFDAGNIVIINHHSLYSVMEVRCLVCSLAAQIVQLVSVLVLGIKEGCDLLNRITI